MIADAVLDVVFGVLASVVALFPTNTLDLSGISEGAGYMSWVGLFVDTSALAAALAVIVGGEAALVGVRFVLFIWRLTPLSG